MAKRKDQEQTAADAPADPAGLAAALGESQEANRAAGLKAALERLGGGAADPEQDAGEWQGDDDAPEDDAPQDPPQDPPGPGKNHPRLTRGGQPAEVQLPAGPEKLVRSCGKCALLVKNENQGDGFDFCGAHPDGRWIAPQAYIHLDFMPPIDRDKPFQLCDFYRPKG